MSESLIEKSPSNVKLKSFRLRNFKRIEDASFDIEDINILVGANNTGKSSVIQGLHFAIGVLQTIKLIGRMPPKTNDNKHSVSLNPAELLYTPAEDVYSLAAGGKLKQGADNGVIFDFVLSTGQACRIDVIKGKNRNIAVGLSDLNAAQLLCDLEKPFSIFSPGLAGIAKSENHVSDGVLLRALARGDANLVLRNILLRIWDVPPAWDGFMTDLREIFPDVDIKVEFKSSIDEHIYISVKVDSGWVPLELSGTGLLQAAQILSYIHRFSPRLVVLDEPDSHLHPNNQRLICSLLRRVAEEREMQVILTTHSRHIVDSIGESASFLWVRSGGIIKASADDEIGILLDIGALDLNERISNSSSKALVLTEDRNLPGLRCLLDASGFDLDSTDILSYFGATQPKAIAAAGESGKQ